MKLFKYIVLLVVLLFIGCDSNTKPVVHICPQCNMPLPKSNLNTSNIGEVHYFDDIGCTILYASDKEIDLKNSNVKVFTNDTKKYINLDKVYFTINEKTPMLYGFSPYENRKDDMINFDKVMMKMLRGEHMANPKIRKQILGY